MNISSRCEYACRAVLELSYYHSAGQTLTVESIADRRHIPEKFLVHILLQLKRAGIVHSIRGARGGYRLAVPPGELTLLDVVRAVDGPILDPLPVQDVGSEDMIPAWGAVARGVEDILRSMTIQDILSKSARPGMYYI